MRAAAHTGGDVTTREHIVRAMWTLFEPIHAVSYFAPQARDAFAEVGLTRYWDGYFAGRAAPLGPVSAAPVIAIFNGFSPFLVERALPAAWEVASVDRVLDARSRGAAAALRSVFVDDVIVATAATELTRVAGSIDIAGRPLAAANAALPEETDPYRQLWRAATILREHRGDGHVAALLSEGIAGLGSIVLRSAIDIETVTMKRARGWSDEQWSAQLEELVGRGLLAPDGSITQAGSAAVNNAERITNQRAVSAWRWLEDDDITRVAAAIAPIAHACGSLFPYPNPIGMPQPWHPDTDPDAVAIAEVPVELPR